MLVDPNHGKKKCYLIDNKIVIVTTDKKGFSKEHRELFYKIFLLNDVENMIKKDIGNDTVSTFAQTPDNVKKISSRQELEQYHDEMLAKKAKTNKSKLRRMLRAFSKAK